MVRLASIRWEDAFQAVTPQINADGLLTQRFDPLLPVQLRFYSYDRHRDFRSCRHNYFELFYLSSGNAVFRMGDQRMDVREGDLVLVNGLLYHNIELPKTGRDRALHGVLLYFLPDMFRGALAARDDLEYLTPFLGQDGSFPHVIAAKTGVPEHIYALMREISSELPSHTARSRVIVKAYLKMILVKLLKHYSAHTGHEHSFTRKRHSIERLDPFFRYLDAHYSEPLSLADAARMVGMSKSHFIHFMKQITGMSFVSYLNQFRVAKAQELMTNTDKSLAEISHEVGFCDQSYFGHVFRKLLHITPHQYWVQLEIDGRRSAGTGS
jgi:AraC-like DNA-binding protein